MSILIACLLTVVIETLFLALVGLRKKEQLPIIVCVNIISSIVLNFVTMLARPDMRNIFGQGIMLLVVLEATVIFSEYFVYRGAFGDLKRMFLKTVAANLLSLLLGGFLLKLIAQNSLLF